MQAVISDSLDFVRYLIDIGVDLDNVVVRESEGKIIEYTALDAAHERGSESIIDLLESAGAHSASKIRRQRLFRKAR